MRNRLISGVLLSALLLCLAGRPLQAGYDYKFDSNPQPMGQFESEIGGKLTRGTVNLLYGWTEFARTPVKMSHGPKRNFAKVFLIGVPYGILRAAGRTGLGVYEILTCYAPQRPIMEPIEGDVV